MKKIFTLIAVAAMAVSANAQGTYALQEGDDAIPAGTAITSVDNITMTYGDGGADFKAPAKADHLKDYLGATAYTEGNGTNGNKPNGTIYYFEPTIAGVLSVGAVINKDKAILVRLDSYSGDKVDYEVFSGDGETPVAVTDDKLAEKTYGVIRLNVEAGKKYAVGLAGSKMGFYGFKFEESELDPTGISSVTKQQQDGVVYNLAGQRVNNAVKGIFIQNGKKFVVK